MARSNKHRRNTDIYNFVTKRLNEKVGMRQKYTFGAVMAMAEQKFYLAQDTIADIYREYVPDPDQITLTFPDQQSAGTGTGTHPK